MKTLLLFLAFLFSSLPSFANVHLGPGQEYPNVQAAFDAKAIHPGDTVFIHAGSYTGYQGIQSLKGDSTHWIVFIPYNNAVHDISGNWQFMSCEYIKFERLNFKANSKSPGRLINVDNSGNCATQSRYIKFNSCSFSDVTDANSITAVKFGGVDNFEVTSCTFTNMAVCDGMDFNVCHNGLISGNLLQNCLTGGHIKGGGRDIIMERNTFLNSSSGTWVAWEIGGDTGPQFFCPGENYEAKNIKFYSNLIIGGYRGLALSSAVDCKVINNTFYNCGQATLRFLTTSLTYPKLTGNIIENNILAFGTSAYINGGVQTADAASFSKNIYYSIINSTFNGPYWDAELDAMKDPNPLNYGSGTKMFVNGSGNDFHLADGSPAIGAGKTETEPATDFYGNPFSTTSRSIGAIEVNIFYSTITASGPTTFCIGDSVILTAGTGSSYVWSTGETTQSITVKTSGVYWVKVTYSNGNSGISPTTTVTVNPLPEAPTITANANILSSSYPTGNQWYLDGDIITGAVFQNYTAVQNGMYTVVYTDNSGCSATSTTFNFILEGINDLTNEKAIYITPNPTNDYIVISQNSTSQSIIQKIEIYTVFGNKVFESEAKDRIDVRFLSPGIYFLKMGNKMYKFVKI